MTKRRFDILIHLIQWMGWTIIANHATSTQTRLVLGALSIYHGIMYVYLHHWKATETESEIARKNER